MNAQKDNKKFYPKILRGAGGCFPHGTLISTPSGKREIQDIIAGDIVYGFDHISNEINEYEVEKTNSHSWEEVGERSPLIKIVQEDGDIILTANHWIFVGENGKRGEYSKYLEAGDLKIGDLLTTEQNKKVKILDIITLGAYCTVYNFEVKDAHNYIASNIRVHNGGGGKGGCFPAGTLVTIPNGKIKIEDIKPGQLIYAYDNISAEIKVSKVTETIIHDWEEVGGRSPLIKIIHELGEVILTANHYVFVGENGTHGEYSKYLEAGDLKIGDFLTNFENKKLKILKIEKLGQYDFVYNLEVDSWHNFIASDIRVHNGGGGGGGGKCRPNPPPDPHTPTEVDEGIYKYGGKKLSRTETEVTDLICEGPIEGLVTGKYTFVGQVNQIGWSSYVLNKYPTDTPYLRSVFWKNVPLLDDAGNYNYSQINFRYDNGNQTSATSLTSNLPSFNSPSIPQASRSLPIGETLRYGPNFVKRYDFKNINMTALILSLKVSSLFDQQNNPNVDKVTYDLGCGSTSKESTTIGDIRDREIKYAFKVYKLTRSGTTLQISTTGSSKGKITSGFVDTYRFDLPTASDEDLLGWRLEIERTTPESTVVNLKDFVTVDAITEILSENYIYPKTAIFKSLFTSEYFQNVPERSYDTRLLKVKIPSNYDPILKTYNGDWDGTFKANLEWTDNPAWCYYDLLTNKRYGLGKYLEQNQIDKWGIYQIAQYCDTIVSDGYGGLEPRFTCNAIINDFSDAFSLLNDMASIFRGMSYYAHGAIFPIADMPKDPYILFTNSNVENGDFSYASSSKKTRNTVAVIRYNDEDYSSKPTVEHVEDPDGIRKYGIRKLEITAFGCTSRGQAYRLGKWALASEQLETETIDFTAGLDSVYLKPGDVIKVQDSNRMMNRLGGRILGISTGIGGKHKFVLDEEFNNISGYFSDNFPGQTYKFEILTPTSRVTGTNYSDFTNNYQRSEIQSGLFQLNSSFITKATGYHPEKTLTEINCNKVFNAIDYTLFTGAIWTAQTTGIGFGINAETELYRVIGITEVEPFKYNINAMEYNPSKYLFIESGFSFTDAPVVTPSAIKEASYPSGLFLYKTEDLYLNYVISGAVDTVNNETDYWKTYVKSGSDFSINDLQIQYANMEGTIVNVPREDFLLSSISVPSDNSDVIANHIPVGNNQNYYYRIYGVNPKGNYSRNFRAGNFYFSSSLLGDYTNLIELKDFKYSSTFDNLQSTALNTANLIHDQSLNLQWNLNNLAIPLKIWTNNELTYRLRFGTGNFDGSGPNNENSNYISTVYYSDPSISSEFSAGTGFNSSDLRSYLKDDVISGFWIAIDARETNGGVKYTSQQTLAGSPFNQPHGYLFGLFQNDQMTPEKYDLTDATNYITSDNNISITIKNIQPYIGSLYVFFTDQITATGYLTTDNLNKIMYEQFDPSKSYKSFITALSGSGIQLREAFFNGVDTFSTATSFFKSDGTDGILKSGYMSLRPSTKFENNLMDQYDKDFFPGTGYNLSNYQKNSDNSVVNSVPVYYGSYPAGLNTTYRFPRVNNIGTAVDTDRQIVNNLVFLPQINSIPLEITSNLGNLIDGGDLEAASGNLNNLINSLSGDAFLKNKINSGDLKLASGYYLNLSGTGGQLIFNSDQVLNATTRTYAPSGYFRLDINGTGVRIPYFKSQ
jgi:uncharacterized protein with GYD domain